jgi:NAD(P)-dependent dehydrogenase (short-subunit alcohol dehydrogenase family)
MAFPIDLQSDVAVVTGGGSGIGEAISKMLARAGASVAVADLSREAAERVAAEISAEGGTALAVSLDIGDRSSVEAARESVVASLGPASILVNNAATWAVKKFLDTTADDVDRVIDVTLKGTINVTQVFLPDVIEAKGRVVFTISDGARIGESHMSVYAAAKSALIGLAKSIAREVGQHGVTVNSVAPGTTQTPGGSAFIEQIGAEKLARAYPLGRLGEPDDIAGAVLFFASPLSSWVTGQVLSVSGGYTML